MPLALTDSRKAADRRDALNAFFASVERRAFLMARLALGSDHDAQDVVQDAMMMLARRYAHKSEDDWRPLFYRIVQNRITDSHRRRRVRDRYHWLPFIRRDNADTAESVIEQFPDRPSNNPEFELDQQQSIEQLYDALKALPLRQQQAFQYRCWEGLSTAETAGVMGCSEGSVKTHYFRALQTLKQALKEYSDE